MPSTLKTSVQAFIDTCIEQAAIRNGTDVANIEHNVIGDPKETDAQASVIVETWVKDNKDATIKLDKESFIAGGDATTHRLTD